MDDFYKCSGCNSKYSRTQQDEVFGRNNDGDFFKTCKHCRGRSLRRSSEKKLDENTIKIDRFIEFLSFFMKTNDGRFNLIQIQHALHHYDGDIEL
jgi:hypothetical protein